VKVVQLPAELVARMEDADKFLLEPAVSMASEEFTRGLGGVLLPELLAVMAAYVERPFWVTSRPARVPAGKNNGFTTWHTDYRGCQHAMYVTGASRTQFQGAELPHGALGLYGGDELHRGLPAVADSARWLVRIVHPPSKHWLHGSSNRRYAAAERMLR